MLLGGGGGEGKGVCGGGTGSSWSRLTRNTSSLVLNAPKEEDSTTPLGNLSWCSTTLTIKMFCLTLITSSFYFSLCPLPLDPSLDTPKKSMSSSSFLSPSGVFTQQ